MAELNKFEAYAGGTGVYHEVETDIFVGDINIVSPDFDLSEGTVTVQYQLRYVDAANTWITLDVPTDAPNHVIIEDKGVKRVRIENTSAGSYNLCVFQISKNLRP